MEKQQLENLTQAYLKVLGLVEQEKVESLDEKCATKKEEMDPVDKKALKKDFKDREDKDIDNDGDEDESDEYLHNRRKAVSKAVKEDVDQLDELSKSTLGSYVKKANQSAMSSAHASAAKTTAKAAEPHIDKMFKRKAGINKAVDRLTKEDIDTLNESDSQQHLLDGAHRAKQNGDMYLHHKYMQKYHEKHAEKGGFGSNYYGGAGSRDKNLAKAKHHGDEAKKLSNSVKEDVNQLDEADVVSADRKSVPQRDPATGKMTWTKVPVQRQKSITSEEFEEVDEAKQPHKFGDTWKSYDAIKKIFHRGFDKKDWTPDEVASVKKHVKIAGRKERGLHPGTGPMDFSAGAMHDHIVKHAKKPVKEDVDQLGLSFEELEEFIMSEEFNQLDEISQDTLRRYHGAAALDLRKKREKLAHGTMTTQDHKQGQRRVVGLNRAANKMESTDNESKYGQHAGMLIDYVQEARENHGNMNNGSPEGEGLSPNAKKEKGRKVEIAHDAEKANMQNFKDFTAKVGVAKKRPNDNDVGDKKVVK